MNVKKLMKASALLTVAMLAITGCSHKEKVSKEQVQYMSHMDQARFFQRQGELKASNQEANSARQLEPHNVEPYLLIVDNLLIVGDSTTAEQELKQIEAHLGKKQPAAVNNKLALDWAKAAMLRKDYSSALEHLSKFEKQKNHNGEEESQFLTLRGQIHLEQGDIDNAESLFNKASKAFPESVIAKVGLSKVAFHQGDDSQAGQLVDEALKMDKDNSQAWLWKAQMAQKVKDYKTSENAYMKALDGIGKYDVMTYQKYQTVSSLIEVLRAEGKIQEAYVYQEMLAKSGPGTIKSDFDAAIKAYKVGDLDKAATHLSDILKRAPQNTQAATLLGLIRFQQGRVQDAQKILKSVEQTGQSLEASKLLAATQIQLGQSQQAQQMLEKLKDNQNDPGVLALVGVAALSSGELTVGRKYIEKSLALKPDNVGLRMRYARWLMSQNDFNAAINQAKEAINTNPNLVSAHRLEVEAELRAHQPKKAYEAVQKWLQTNPKNVAAIITKGDLETSQHHYKKALAEYMQAEKLNPKSPSVQVALGNLLLTQKQKDKAIPYFRKAVALAPNNKEALQALMRVSLTDSSHLNQTLTFLKKLADTNPKAAGPRVILFEDALKSNNFEESERLADEINRLGSNNRQGVDKLMATVYTNVAMADIQNKKQNEAKKVINLATKRFPKNLQIGLINAQLMFVTGNEAGASKILSTLKREHHDSPKPYLVEASYRTEKKEYDQAINLYELALQKSEDPNIFIQLSHVQNEAGHQEQMLKTLEKAVELYPDQPDVILQLGLAYQSANDLDKAEKAYQKLLRIAPNEPIALNNLAWIYQKTNDKRALEVAKHAYEIQPNSAPIADTYGWIMYSQGQVKASIPILEKAYTLAPNVKDIALHLAEAYKANGQPSKAKALLEKF